MTIEYKNKYDFINVHCDNLHCSFCRNYHISTIITITRSEWENQGGE